MHVIETQICFCSKSNIYLKSVSDTVLSVDIDYLESSQERFSVDIILTLQ